MSKLEDLLQELCPNGVEYKKLGSVAEIGTGNSNGNEASENGKYPFFIRSNTIKLKNDYEYDEESIIIPGEGGVGEIFHYISGKYALHQRVYRIHFLENDVITKFAFYYMQASFRNFITKRAVSATVRSIRKPMIEQFTLPIPPLEVQQEIVRILDQFTELTAELTAKLNAELTARKKQYEYYRDELLHKKSFFDVRECRLGEVADIHTGSKPDEILEEHSEFEYINAGTTNSGYTKMPNCPGDTVTTPSRGQGGIGFVGYQSQPFHLGPLCYAIRSSDENFIINKFIYYWLSSHTGDILAFKKEGGTPALNRGDLTGLKLCVPHIAVQRRIVEILDRFNFLRYNLTSGLPAEIEARRKQYEYYRDKVLTFEKI